MLPVFSHLLAPDSLDHRLAALRRNPAVYSPNLPAGHQSSQRLAEAVSSCQAVGAQRLESVALAQLPAEIVCIAPDESGNLCSLP